MVTNVAREIGFVKQFLGTLDLGVFNAAQLHRIHGAFRFSHKEDVSEASFLEGYCPVWRVVAYRCRDLKGSRKFCVNRNFFRHLK